MEKKEIIVFGRNPVLEYLKNYSHQSNDIILISQSAHGKIINTIINESNNKGIKIQYCEKGDLSRYSSSSKHQGVILITHKYTNIISDKEFIEKIQHEHGILVLLDQLTDPYNVGSIIRTTEALGGKGVVIPKSHSTDITSTVIKSSAGATTYLRIINIQNVAVFLDMARKIGYWIIGTSVEGDTELTKIKDLKPAIIIIGNEGSGMRRLTQEKCDCIIGIPLKGNIASLNASVSAGIILYEALKE